MMALVHGPQDHVVFVDSSHGNGDGRGNSYLCLLPDPQLGRTTDERSGQYWDRHLAEDLSFGGKNRARTFDRTPSDAGRPSPSSSTPATPGASWRSWSPTSPTALVHPRAARRGTGTTNPSTNTGPGPTPSSSGGSRSAATRADASTWWPCSRRPTPTTSSSTPAAVTARAASCASGTRGTTRTTARSRVSSRGDSLRPVTCSVCHRQPAPPSRPTTAILVVVFIFFPPPCIPRDARQNKKTPSKG